MDNEPTAGSMGQCTAQEVCRHAKWWEIKLKEQIRLLDEIGFRWQANKSPAKSADDPEAVASTGAAAAAAASPYQANEMTTDQAQNLLALSEYPEFEGNI